MRQDIKVRGTHACVMRTQPDPPGGGPVLLGRQGGARAQQRTARPAMSSSPGSARGPLIREAHRLTLAVESAHGRLARSEARLAEAKEGKAQALTAVAAAQRELEGASREREREARNDGELTLLQRSAAALNARLQECIRATKAGRGRRDGAREAALLAHYARRGVEAEAQRAYSSAQGQRAFELSGAAPVWGRAALELLGEATALWRRASDASVLARDVLEGAAQRAGSGGLTLEEQEAVGGAGGAAAAAAAAAVPHAPAASVLYGALGAPAVLADARRALSALAELQEALGGLEGRCEAAGGAAGAAAAGGEGAGAEGEGEGEEEEEEEGGAAGSAAMDSDALHAVQAAARMIGHNARLQQLLLLGVVAALEA